MSTPVTDPDELFQLAYTKAIFKLLGRSKSDDGVSKAYVAPFETRGVTAGKNIPDEVSNNLVCSLADGLLSLDTDQYNAAVQDSYVDALYTYLSWVQLVCPPIIC
jgi:hypothetical protein